MDSYDEWRKKRESGLLVLAAIPVILLFACGVLISVLAPDIPRILKFYALAAALIVGVAISGPRGMRKVCYTEEELLWGYSSLVAMSVFFSYDAWTLLKRY